MPVSATIIDLDEVRRRRRHSAADRTPETVRPMVTWVPVWVMVPVWTLA